MPELIKIESDLVTSNYTPPSGYVSQFTEQADDGTLLIRVKKSDGTFENIGGVDPNSHIHTNKTVLDLIGESDSKLTFSGVIVGEGDMKKSIYDTNNDGVVDKASELVGFLNTEISGAIQEKHTHTNKSVLDLLGTTNNELTFRGSVIGNLPNPTETDSFAVGAIQNRGNDSDCKFLIQPSTSNNQIIDSAAGNSAPIPINLTSYDGQTVSVNASGDVVCPGTHGYGYYAAIEIPANSLPSDVLISGHEWTVEVDFTTTTVSGTQYIFGRADNARFDLLIRDGTFQYGGINISSWGSISVGRNLVTYEHYYDTTSASWVLGCYLNGVFKAAGTPQNNGNFRNLALLIGNAALSNSSGLNGLIHSFRITNSAPHKGQDYTPMTRPYLNTITGWLPKTKTEVRSLLAVTESWYTIQTTTGAVTVDVANGTRQKLALDLTLPAGTMSLTAPTLSADVPELLLQITVSTSQTVTIDDTAIINTAGTWLVKWYFDGTTTRRLTAEEVEG